MKREENIIAVRKNITWKKGKEEQYHLPSPYVIRLLGSISRRGRERKFLGRKSRFIKMGVGKNIKLSGASHTPASVQPALLEASHLLRLGLGGGLLRDPDIHS